LPLLPLLPTLPLVIFGRTDPGNANDANFGKCQKWQKSHLSNSISHHQNLTLFTFDVDLTFPQVGNRNSG